MAVMRVAAEALEHLLDLPEGVAIVDITSEYGGPNAPRSFLFKIEGTNPETGEELRGNVDATYSEDDEGVHFVGFAQMD